ncbi:unnamed protein product [Caenorhabditis sp. 36 PRJEB53466]|nr:unnamed protein product [Caenorhabditis sp. 36 PRJEB53466]
MKTSFIAALLLLLNGTRSQVRNVQVWLDYENESRGRVAERKGISNMNKLVIDNSLKTCIESLKGDDPCTWESYRSNSHCQVMFAFQELDASSQFMKIPDASRLALINYPCSRPSNK